MKKIILINKITLLVFILTIINFAQNDKYKLEGETHLTNIIMLTDGGENAEAYLSFDEQKIIFQATVAELKCDQIFTMNLDGS